jgi:ComF family protein
MSYSKQGVAQDILHALKYKNRKQIGMDIGSMFGRQLSSHIGTVDIIIPVPLHPRKLQLRGYNQSEMIANGLAQELSGLVRTDLISRVINTQTQTKKSRLDRIESLDGVFAVINKKEMENKKIILVDDVVTTGSTIISVGKLIADAGCKEMLIAVAARA